MADPEARVTITGRDATGAAFSSADKNLKQFQRSAMGMKSLLASFGVIFSGRALAGWISSAVKAAEVTGEAGEKIVASQEAMSRMKAASDALAVSIGTSLIPAFVGLANVLTGLNAQFFGASPFAFEKEINNASAALDVLKRKLESMEKFGGYRFVDRDKLVADIAAAELALDALKQKQLNSGPQATKTSQWISDEEVAMVNDLIAYINKPFAPHNMITQEERVVLESFLHELNQPGPLINLISDEELAAVEDTLAAINNPYASHNMITQEELIDLESFINDLNTMDTEAAKTAESLGLSFKSAFASWLGGAEHGFKDLLKRMAAELATSAIFSAFATMFSGGTSGASKFFANFFGGARAEGGPVSAGKGYLVGERGPEMFFPGQSGMVAANAGGSITINNNIDARGADPSVISRLPAILAENNQRLKAEIRHERGRGR